VNDTAFEYVLHKSCVEGSVIFMLPSMQVMGIRHLIQVLILSLCCLFWARKTNIKNCIFCFVGFNFYIRGKNGEEI